MISNPILTAIAIAALSYIYFSERRKNWALARKKKRLCYRRQRLQSDIDEYRGVIGFHILCPIKGSARNFVDWMRFKVNILDSKCDESQRKLIRVVLEEGRIYKKAGSIRMTVHWPAGKISEEFFWGERSCDNAMRDYLLINLKHILSKMPSRESMALMAMTHPGQ